MWINTSLCCVCWVSLSLSYLYIYLLTLPSHFRFPIYLLENRPSNNKHPLLLPPHPLHNAHSGLRQRLPRGSRRRNGVQLEQRRRPRQGNAGTARLVVDLQRGRALVQRVVQLGVQGEEASTVQGRGEVGGVAGHDELDIATGFVQEVAERGAGDNVGAGWTAEGDGGGDVGDGFVGGKGLYVKSWVSWGCAEIEE